MYALNEQENHRQFTRIIEYLSFFNAKINKNTQPLIQIIDQVISLMDVVMQTRDKSKEPDMPTNEDLSTIFERGLEIIGLLQEEEDTLAHLNCHIKTSELSLASLRHQIENLLSSRTSKSKIKAYKRSLNLEVIRSNNSNAPKIYDQQSEGQHIDQSYPNSTFSERTQSSSSKQIDTVYYDVK